jgi:hypothetical protein
MSKVVIIFLAVIGLAAVPVPVSAHHGNASYDETRTVTVKGTVTSYSWQNPHILLRVDAKDDTGNTLHWIIEAQSTVSQTASGWTRTTFKPGDEVVIDVVPIKSGNPVGRFKGRIVINGTVFKPAAPGR